MTEGLFVTVEGIDGAGKSTIVETLEDYYGNEEPENPVTLPDDYEFNTAGETPDVVTTSEPSDYWTGDAVYRAIGSESETPPLSDFFFFMGDRVNHIENRIRPALDDDKMVISDRYADSTMAYQPHALRDQMDNPKEYMRSLMGEWNLKPDVTIFLDVSVDTALQRLDGGDKYEKKEFLQEVQRNYYDLMDEEPDRFKFIDGELPKNAVKMEALDIIENARHS